MSEQRQPQQIQQTMSLRHLSSQPLRRAGLLGPAITGGWETTASAVAERKPYPAHVASSSRRSSSGETQEAWISPSAKASQERSYGE